MNITAIVNIWFVDTAMENNIVTIIKWDKIPKCSRFTAPTCCSVINPSDLND